MASASRAPAPASAWSVSGYDDVTIAGGAIRQFAVGIRVATSTDLVIRQIEFIANAEGIDFQAGSIHNTVKDSAFRLSSTRAIMLRGNSQENDIKANTFADNRIGILVFGGVDNSIKNNLIAGSSLAGIRFNVIATGNVIKDNIIMSNAAGVEFLATPTGSATGNELKANTIAANACGLKGATAGNDIHDNSFENNTLIRVHKVDRLTAQRRRTAPLRSPSRFGYSSRSASVG